VLARELIWRQHWKRYTQRASYRYEFTKLPVNYEHLDVTKLPCMSRFISCSRLSKLDNSRSAFPLTRLNSLRTRAASVTSSTTWSLCFPMAKHFMQISCCVYVVCEGRRGAQMEINSDQVRSWHILHRTTLSVSQYMSATHSLWMLHMGFRLLRGPIWWFLSNGEAWCMVVAHWSQKLMSQLRQYKTASSCEHKSVLLSTIGWLIIVQTQNCDTLI
jgi:hypothetical protein